MKRRTKTKISKKLRRYVLARDSHTCYRCARHENNLNTDEYMTLDHVLPRAKGGYTCKENLRAMCSTCNNKKGNKWFDPITIEQLNGG